MKLAECNWLAVFITAMTVLLWLRSSVAVCCTQSWLFNALGIANMAYLGVTAFSVFAILTCENPQNG